eukprot:TRINITY_DN2810_c0_g1_i1.p1 TRINITY_DN2810_c0_g1~~TRINITY_DN2810_c0_g1_i1.p1  ORF type:complete len:175 (-),score=36.71 TRINITY_DN2810_c0_g1_i1:55-579(-)
MNFYLIFFYMKFSLRKKINFIFLFAQIYYIQNEINQQNEIKIGAKSKFFLLMIAEFTFEEESQEKLIQWKSKAAQFFNQKSQFINKLQKQREQEHSFEISDQLLNQKSPLQNDSMKNYFQKGQSIFNINFPSCLLYTSDAADEEDSVDLGGCRIIEKKKQKERMVAGGKRRKET